MDQLTRIRFTNPQITSIKSDLSISSVRIASFDTLPANSKCISIRQIVALQSYWGTQKTHICSILIQLTSWAGTSPNSKATLDDFIKDFIRINYDYTKDPNVLIEFESLTFFSLKPFREDPRLISETLLLLMIINRQLFFVESINGVENFHPNSPFVISIFLQNLFNQHYIRKMMITEDCTTIIMPISNLKEDDISEFVNTKVIFKISKNEETSETELVEQKPLSFLITSTSASNKIKGSDVWYRLGGSNERFHSQSRDDLVGYPKYGVITPKDKIGVCAQPKEKLLRHVIKLIAQSKTRISSGSQITRNLLGRTNDPSDVFKDFWGSLP
ncbi:hypothetical protein WICPIJ_009856 [Wickerhamomyces pijperi]|uniref:Uncharacterized protein n=1 Tax=Wickerhamomyces pijperi TaxID=599730 RepID=A0A9P8PK07_WICPI|nr:hypothetical protein WICPIJ_009856 [Wickerhamomyces pijperi]